MNGGPSTGRSAVDRRRLILAGVLGLLLVSEMALGPFYPQLFRDVYGRTDPSDTGLFVWASRLSAMIALPLLGLLARRIGAQRVVTGGLVVAACADVALPFAPTFEAFTVISAIAAASGSALLLAYPALVQLDDEEGGAPGIVWFAGLFHAAVIAAAAAGALIVALPDPRIGLAAFAPVTLTLLVLSRRAMGSTTAADATDDGRLPVSLPETAMEAAEAARLTGADLDGSEAEAHPTTHVVQGDMREMLSDADPAYRVGRQPVSDADRRDDGTGPRDPRDHATRRRDHADRRDRRRALVAAVVPLLIGFALIATVLDFSMAVVRPFFVSALEEDGRGAALSAALFLLPSVAALATLPFAVRAEARFGRALLPLALLVGAGGLALQTVAADQLPALVAGRVLFGVGIVLAQVEVDRRIFAVAGVDGPGFAASETARGLGLVLAPLAAAAAATNDLLLPLAVGAAGLALAAVAALIVLYLPHPARKATRVPSL